MTFWEVEENLKNAASNFKEVKNNQAMLKKVL